MKYVMKNQLPSLSIDPEFQRMVAPLSKILYRRLENDTIKFGCKEPIYTWCNIVIDGYSRYEICQKYNIPFQVKDLIFPNRYEVIRWIITTQLKRMDLMEESRRYLIGKQFLIDKITNNVPDLSDISSSEVKLVRLQRHNPLTIYLAKDYHISASTVNRYAQYAKAIDYIGEFLPDHAARIAYGMLRISIGDIIRLSKESISEIKLKLDIINRESIVKTPKKDIPNSKPVMSIKDMPQYDPDAYIMSLAFTIPTWIQSIEKARTNSEMNRISNIAKNKLYNLLDELISASSKMLIDLEE